LCGSTFLARSTRLRPALDDSWGWGRLCFGQDDRNSGAAAQCARGHWAHGAARRWPQAEEPRARYDALTMEHQVAVGGACSRKDLDGWISDVLCLDGVDGLVKWYCVCERELIAKDLVIRVVILVEIEIFEPRDRFYDHKWTGFNIPREMEEIIVLTLHKSKIHALMTFTLHLKACKTCSINLLIRKYFNISQIKMWIVRFFLSFFFLFLYI